MFAFEITYFIIAFISEVVNEIHVHKPEMGNNI